MIIVDLLEAGFVITQKPKTAYLVAALPEVEVWRQDDALDHAASKNTGLAIGVTVTGPRRPWRTGLATEPDCTNSGACEHGAMYAMSANSRTINEQQLAEFNAIHERQPGFRRSLVIRAHDGASDLLPLESFYCKRVGADSQLFLIQQHHSCARRTSQFLQTRGGRMHSATTSKFPSRASLRVIIPRA